MALFVSGESAEAESESPDEREAEELLEKNENEEGDKDLCNND